MVATIGLAALAASVGLAVLIARWLGRVWQNKGWRGATWRGAALVVVFLAPILGLFWLHTSYVSGLAADAKLSPGEIDTNQDMSAWGVVILSFAYGLLVLPQLLVGIGFALFAPATAAYTAITSSDRS